jgi:hypothetical protein
MRVSSVACAGESDILRAEVVAAYKYPLATITALRNEFQNIICEIN